MRNLLILILCCFSLIGYTQGVERVEPPFWWVGMNNANLQLMLYGEDLAQYTVSTRHKDVKLVSVDKADSPNYLFVNLDIGSLKEPVTTDIVLRNKLDQSIRFAYEFKARDEGSAERAGFDNSDVIYLITPDRFVNGDTSNDEIEGMREGLNRSAEYGRHGGDIAGIAQSIDYIKEMGFTSIWLNPVLENDQDEWSYHGYATTDYYKVDPRFGSNDEYRDLALKAKESGMGMIMDIIVNHCGSFHWWMEDPPFEDWINEYTTEYQETNHRKTTLLDPHVSVQDRRVMTEGWFVPAMPDLNQRNKWMSTYLIQNSIWWIEFAYLTGIRQDTYSYPFRDFMTDWTCAIMKEYPNFNIVGEEWVELPSIIAYWQEGKDNRDGYRSCLPSLMDFPLVMTLRNGLKEDEGWASGLNKMYEMLAQDYNYAHPEDLVIFPDNHDMPRIYTYLKEDYDLFKIAIAYTLTMRGTPQLYYGTEILMSHPESDSHGMIREDFPGGWEGDAMDAFNDINMDDLAIEAREWIRKLIKWRNGKEVVHRGALMHFIPQDNVYTYFRYTADLDPVMVMISKSEEAQTISLDRFDEVINGRTSFKDIMSGEAFTTGNGITIQPKSVRIFEFN